MQTSFGPFFGSGQVQLHSAGNSLWRAGKLLEFLNRLSLAAKLQETMPFELKSPNAIPPAKTLMGFLVAEIV